jgi:hypothetical protein
MCATACPAETFEAVNCTVTNGYTRNQMPDGTYQRETYVFKEGGFLSGQVDDESIDRITFKQVSDTIAGALRDENYVQASEASPPKLLIVVYWGTSRTPMKMPSRMGSGGIHENLPRVQSPRSHEDFGGKADEGWEALQGRGFAFGGHMVIEEDAAIMGFDSASNPDLSEARYFVVLLAYDYRVLSQQKKAKLLWQARFSITERQNRFNEKLAAMAAGASRYFGQDTSGLRYDPVPEGSVKIGEIRPLETVAEPALASLSPDGVHVAFLRSGRNSRVLEIVDLSHPGQAGVAPLSTAEAVPDRLGWPDDRHVLVGFPGTATDAYGIDGRPYVDPGGFRAPATDARPSRADIRSDPQAQAESIFPGRKVAIIGSDRAGSRFLLAVSKSEGSVRYFVMDLSSGLLIYVGQPAGVP